MARLLDFMINASSASNDDVVEVITKMANPESFEDRSDFEGYYDECLGYKPMEYFHIKDLSKKLQELEPLAPYSVQDQLRSKKDRIIAKSLDCLDEIEDALMDRVLSGSIKNIIGWDSTSPDDSTLDEIVEVSLFGQSEIEEDEDDELSLTEDDDDTDGDSNESDEYDDDDEFPSGLIEDD